jgi:hypothetical protein
MLTNKPLSLFIFFSLSVCFYAQSQNLVPNGSFEEGNFCPEFLGDLHLGCADWYAGIQAPGTDPNDNPSPDWFHTCAPNVNLQPPATIFGFQEPCEGNGYAGIATFASSHSNAREIISVALNEGLIVGQVYNIKLQIVRSNRLPQFAYASNNMSVRFTTYPYWNNLESAITNWSHYRVEELIVDTLNWMQIDFEFTADSTYHFFHIGNFYDDQNTLTEYLFDGFGGTQTYYFVDCVSVNHIISTTVLNPLSNQESLYPNPAINYIEVTGDFNILSISFFDAFGRKVEEYTTEDRNNHRFNIAHLNSGMYVVKLLDEKLDLHSYKLLKSN